MSLKVLFITGFGRSGTTLLDNILGQLEGFCSLGEVSYIWDRAVRDNRLCGCGKTFRECEFWSRLGGPLTALSDQEIAEIVRVRDSLGTGAVVLRNFFGRGELPEITAYAARLQELYEAVHRRTECRVVIDSSKAPPHGYVLERVSGIELYIVHMVRDPRAVAFSWQKTMVYDPSGEPMYMTRHNIRRSCTLWSKWNLAAELLWRRKGRYLLLRYEDFVACPRQAVRRILDLLGEKAAALPFVEPHRVQLDINHTVGGNPGRFKTGEIEIRRDDEWRRNFPRWKKMAVVGLTAPLLARYGYLFKAG